MEITKDTRLADLIAQYPWLKAEMAKVNEKFKMLNTPGGGHHRENQRID